MGWLEAALWGLAGGLIVEGLEFYTAVRRHNRWPWNVDGPGPRAGVVSYLIAESIRLVIGGVLASAAAASDQVAGPLAAIAIGVATPFLVERLTGLIPLALETAPDAILSNDLPGQKRDEGQLNPIPSTARTDEPTPHRGHVAASGD